MSAAIDIGEIRALARQFATDELRPHVERWDHDGALDEGVLAQLGELGFLGMDGPESDGGMGLDTTATAAALEALAWGEAAVAFTVAQAQQFARVLREAGSAAPRAEWAGRIAAGEATACLALAEATGTEGEDAPRARARRAGGGWRIDGEKRWVTNASRAAVALVSAETEEGPTLFAVPTTTAGWNVGPRDSTMGLRPVEIATVRLSGMEVGEDAVVGPAGGAVEVLAAAADAHRIAVGAMAAGIARAAFDHARAYADVREQFGQRLRAFEGIQFKLADMAMRVEAAHHLVGRAAADFAATPGLAAMAKIFASESAMWVTTQAVQIFGGYGYMRDYPVEKLMRDAKAMELVGDANDVLRVHIAEALYRA